MKITIDVTQEHIDHRNDSGGYSNASETICDIVEEAFIAAKNKIQVGDWVNVKGTGRIFKVISIGDESIKYEESSFWSTSECVKLSPELQTLLNKEIK